MLNKTKFFILLTSFLVFCIGNYNINESRSQAISSNEEVGIEKLLEPSKILKTYNNEQLGISLSYPSNWDQTNNIHKNFAIIFSPWSNVHIDVGVIPIQCKGPCEISLSDSVQIYLESLGPKFKLTDAEIKTINEKDFYFMYGNGKDVEDQYDAKETHIVTVQNNTAYQFVLKVGYLFGFGSTEKERELLLQKMQPPFLEMVKSAKLSGSDDEYQLPSEEQIMNNVIADSGSQSNVLKSEGINDSLQGLDTNDPCPEGYSLSQTSGKCEEMKQNDPCPERYSLSPASGKCEEETEKQSTDIQDTLGIPNYNINTGTENINELFNTASLAFNSGRYQEAIEYFDKALAIDPNNKGALTNKGVTLVSLKKYEEAIEQVDKALAIDPNFVEALSLKGVVLHNLDRYQEAIEYLDKALAIDHNHNKALSTKGSALSKLGEYQQAIEYFDKALAIKPNDIQTLSWKGFALIFLGKHQEAIESLDKALAINPNDKRAIDIKNFALNQMKNNN